MTTKNFVIKTGLDLPGVNDVQDYILRHDSDIQQIVVDHIADTADLQAQIDALEISADSDVIDIKKLRREADSDTIAIQALSTTATSQAATITTILGMLDSDGVNLQALRTDLEAEIAATNVDVNALTARLDSDSAQLQNLQTQIGDITGDDLVRIRARLDSDSAYIQGLDTRLRAEIAATNADVTSAESRLDALEGRADSDDTALQSLDTRLRAEIEATNSDVSSLQGQIDDNASAISSLQTFTGEGTALDTSASNLAAAINEVKATADSIGNDYLSLADGGTVEGDTTFTSDLKSEDGIEAITSTGVTVANFAPTGMNVITTTTSTANVDLVEVSAGSGAFMIQAKSNGQTHFTQVHFARNASDVYYNEHSEIFTSNSLFTVEDVTWTGTQVKITIAPASAASTVFKVTGTAIAY